MLNPLSVLVLGAGDRGSKLISRAKNQLVPTAVADPNKHKRVKYAKEHNINSAFSYTWGKLALDLAPPVDFVYIATPDETHHRLATLALKKGYNVLLEKPIATTEQDCRDIIEAQEKSGKALSVCHVLRYAPFFMKIQEVTESGELGELQGIDLTEQVGYWHYAHSYVRGNWRRQEDSSPIILAKSCHDMDILTWLADSNPRTLFSRGSLDFFTGKNAPKGATKKCTDGCPVEGCIYDARDFYVGEQVFEDRDGKRHEKVVWPYNVFSDNPNQGQRLEELAQSSYGNCVFQSDNNVCDNQDVVVEFDNDVTANFRLRYHGEVPNRLISVNFSRGNISGSFIDNQMTVTRYGKKTQSKKETISLAKQEGHGGGDAGLVRNFVELIQSGNPNLNKTSAQRSLQSHLMAFAAEKSRKTGNPIIF